MVVSKPIQVALCVALAFCCTICKAVPDTSLFPIRPSIPVAFDSVHSVQVFDFTWMGKANVNIYYDSTYSRFVYRVKNHSPTRWLIVGTSLGLIFRQKVVDIVLREGSFLEAALGRSIGGRQIAPRSEYIGIVKIIDSTRYCYEYERMESDDIKNRSTRLLSGFIYLTAFVFDNKQFAGGTGNTGDVLEQFQNLPAQDNLSVYYTSGIVPEFFKKYLK